MSASIHTTTVQAANTALGVVWGVARISGTHFTSRIPNAAWRMPSMRKPRVSVGAAVAGTCQAWNDLAVNVQIGNDPAVSVYGARYEKPKQSILR